ncbi:MAG: T9SS type A sorting domain-containing protein, partial [Bacteroidota bacterium]
DYSLEYTDANGCSATSNTISVNVSDSPIPTVSVNGNATICEGSSVELVSSIGDTYSWTFNGNAIAETTQNITVAAEGLYVVTVTNADACNGVGSSQPVLISVNPTPTADASFVQTNGSLTVQFLNNSSNASSYVWNFGDGNTSTSSNPNYTYTTGGDYVVTLTASNGNCTDVFTLNLASVSVSENTTFAELSVYPNPTSETLNIEFGQEMTDWVNIEMFDMTGKLVKTSQHNVTTGSNFIQLNVSELETGIYFLNMHNSLSSVSVRVVKK